MDIDGALTRLVQKRQIPIFGIANADGFEYALPGWRPKELMPRCKSVVLFGRPFEGYPPYIVNKRHIAADSWWEANEVVFREVSRWRGEIIDLFDEFGLATANFGGYGPTSEPTFSYRLAQHEAGIGKLQCHTRGVTCSTQADYLANDALPYSHRLLSASYGHHRLHLM